MNKTLIGKNGYLFLINDSSNEIIKHCNPICNINIDHINLYKSVDNYLLLVYPDKSYIYNKYLPDNYNCIYRPVLNKYKELLSNKIIDLYECLKNEEDVYYKTDTHINLKGNYIVYNKFVEIIKNMYNIELPKIYLDNLKKKTVTSLAELSLGIGDLTWKSNLGEQTLNLTTDNYYSDNYLDNNDLLYYNKTIINDKTIIKLLAYDSLIDETSKYYNVMFNWDIISKYILYRKNNNCTNNLKVIIFYDSLLCQAIHLYLNLFSEIYFIKDIFNLSYIKKINPNLIFEFRVERFLF